VIAGLHLLQALDASGTVTSHPIEVVCWTNEEGARFAPAMMGSAFHAGRLTAADLLARCDENGQTLHDALSSIGYAGSDDIASDHHCYLELHIEQGPLLEDAGLPIGVVSGVQGMRWTRVIVTGQAGHAGTYPMERRRDALVAAAALVTEVQRIGLGYPELGRATVGRLLVAPNSPNVIPGGVELMVEFRHPDDAALDAMERALDDAVQAIAERTGVDMRTVRELSSPVVHFSPAVVDFVADAADVCGLRSQRMLSGAGIALALGGGGARGCAHLGAIEELERRGAKIVAIAGTSMGAAIGGVYAAGQLAGYRQWLESLNHRDVIRLLDPSLRSPGLITADKVMAHIREYIGDIRIEDLPFPFTAVATDLLSGREVWFQEGPLDRAIRASIAIPSVITPVIEGNRMLVDGGLVDLVPMMPLAATEAELLIAVSLVGSPHGAQAAARPVPDSDFETVTSDAARARDQDMIRRLLSRLGWESQDPGPGDAESSAGGLPSMRTVDVMELAIQTMQRTITRYQFSSFPPDVLVELPTDICGTMEFHRAKEMAELGRARTAAVLDAMAG